MVVGFPKAGDDLCTTVGAVSRTSSGGLAGRTPLRVQIDAAINSGNSGGPVFLLRSDELVGVAYQSINPAKAAINIINVTIINVTIITT